MIVAAALTVTAALAVALAGQALPPWPGLPAVNARSGVPSEAVPNGIPAYAIVDYPNGLARTPPMGWNPYNRFGRSATAEIIEATARALVASHMKALGYVYVNLDGGWDLDRRNSRGELQANPAKFPRGIKPVADYVHSLGLKFGIYTSVGYGNCIDTSAGSYGHYQQDADTFASWGVDYVKVDWCRVPYRNFPTMTHQAVSQMLAKEFGNALLSTRRKIVLDLNDWADGSTPAWGRRYGNLWRTTSDIYDRYSSVLANFMRDVNDFEAAGPDHWNDPDLLEVGNSGMSITQQRTQFTLWAELAAPLIASTDLRNMSPETLAILTNAAVIAVDQDPFGVQGYPVSSRGGHWVLTKPLANGDRAVVLFNQDSRAAVISSNVMAIGLPGSAAYEVRNLWTNATAATNGPIAAEVPADGCVMLLIGPQSAAD